MPEEKGLLIVYTVPRKGKTTCVLGKWTGPSAHAELIQLGVPYTVNGFVARQCFNRANRDVAIRFMKCYLECIVVFNTNKDVALNILKKHTRLDDMSLVQPSYE